MSSSEPGSNTVAMQNEVEVLRSRWESARRKDHLDFVKQIPPFHISSTFMDYLHGDVREEEQWWACHFEYARESRVMREVAKERDALRRANPQMSCEGIVLTVAGQHPDGWWVGTFSSLKFLMCESFPGKDWSELSEAERNEIMDGPSRRDPPPLPITDVWTLKGLLNAPPWSDKLSAMLSEAAPVVEDVLPGMKGRPVKLVWPVLEKWKSVYWAVIDVDFSKSETQLVQEFKEWLRLPENQNRLQEFKKSKTGTTGHPLDRLKDLAAWRLYRELHNDWNAANAFANKNRKQFTAREIREKFKTKEQRRKVRPGDARPFRDAKPKARQQPSEADLFGEDADARKVKARVWEFLTEIMPKEFAAPGRSMIDAFVRLERQAAKD